MCNKCGKPTPNYTCGCNEIKFTGCSTFTDAKCMQYTGTPLVPLGVTKGDSLENILMNINDMFSGIYIDIDNSFLAENVGDGVGVYKGVNDDGVDEFKTLKEGMGVLIENKGDTVDIKIDTVWLEGYLKSFIQGQWFSDFLNSRGQ